jgi:6-phosphogluconolactonase
VSLEVYEGKERLAEAAARFFVERAQRSIDGTGRFAVALAGGSTPQSAYELLADAYRDDLDWGKVHTFFGDERGVPPDHEDSNYRTANEALLSRVPVGSVHRMRGELPPSEAAAEYERELRGFFGGPPVFDLVLLGVGEDGHTASLFPRTPALDATDRFAVENPVEKLGTTRITLTAPTINAARNVAFLVSGGDKAEALKEILEGNADPRDYPAKLIRPAGNPAWMVDRAAARLLRAAP